MKKEMNNLVKIAGAGCITVIVCVFLLFLSSMIPQRLIQENSSKSADYYMEQELFSNKLGGFFFSRQDNYADCILSNIIYHIDSTHPIVSTLRASYYQPEMENVNTAFAAAVDGEVTPDVDYYRYWHGSMTLVRPLLMVMDITGVRLVLGMLAILLAVLAAVLLWKRGEKVLAVVFAIGLCLIDVWMICFCIEYVTTFLVMGVASIAVIMRATGSAGEKAADKDYADIFLAAGIVTAFMDFLTTETITCTIPLMLLFVILFHGNKMKGLKQAFLFLFPFVSYAILPFCMRRKNLLSPCCFSWE